MADSPLNASRSGSQQMRWALDGRHTHTLFRLAREGAEEHIQRYRLRLIELERFSPQPQKYDPDTETFAQFDGKSKDDRIADLERWMAVYEDVPQFCLKMEAIVSHYEAEEFGQQIAEFFGQKRP